MTKNLFTFSLTQCLHLRMRLLEEITDIDVKWGVTMLGNYDHKLLLSLITSDSGRWSWLRLRQRLRAGAILDWSDWVTRGWVEEDTCGWVEGTRVAERTGTRVAELRRTRVTELRRTRVAEWRGHVWLSWGGNVWLSGGGHEWQQTLSIHFNSKIFNGIFVYTFLNQFVFRP